MRRSKRVVALLVALTTVLPMANNICANASNQKRTSDDMEHSYAVNVLPDYLTANDIAGENVWISEAYTLTNVASEEAIGNAYLVFSDNNYIGFIEVQKIDSVYYSSFVTDDYEELQTAYDNDEPVALYFDDDTFCISVEENLNAVNNTCSVTDNLPDTNVVVEYTAIARATLIDAIDVQSTRSVVYNNTLAVTPVSNAEMNGNGICWVYSLTAKYNYLNGTDFTGIEMYELIDEEFYDTFNEHPIGYWRWINKTAEYLEVGNTRVSPMDYIDVYGQINFDNPIYCGVTRTGGAHAVLLCGMTIYSDGSGVYRFADPNFSNYVSISVPSDAMNDGNQLVYTGGYTYSWSYAMY